ncbi:sensor histidine kinase [Flammeovirga agarivorans]|nr:histidine kinase [Flammeovirga agarivorans]
MKLCFYFIEIKKITLGIVSILLCFIIILYLNTELMWFFKWNYYISSNFRSTISVEDFSEVFFPFGIGAGIEIVFEYLKQLKIRQALILEKTKAELNFLKGQLSPHFLFNTINTIFWLIVKDPKNAQDLLLTLSDMLRYQLYECEQDFVPLKKEVDYLNHLIKIQNFRKRENVKVDVIINFENDNYQIPPLLFLPLVENALKYVSQREDEENFIYVNLQQNGNSCVFKIRNSTDDSVIQLSDDKKYSGIGLSNIKKRLNLLYGDNFEFSTYQLNNIYHASVKI